MIEGRGNWIHDSTCVGFGGAKIVEKCYEHGLNVICPKVPWLTGPERSITIVMDDGGKRLLRGANPKYWRDVVAPMIAEAHKLGMEVHAWIFFLHPTSIDFDRSLMQISKTGDCMWGGCPANPETVNKNLEKIEPILGEYDLDGFNLEDCFIYDIDTCFCHYCKQNSPTDLHEKKNWNRIQLTNMLKKIVKESKKYSSKLKISVSARVPYANHSLVLSADWKEWCNLGLLDYLAPMIYETDNAKLRANTEETLQLTVASRVPVYIGLGAYLLDRTLTPPPRHPHDLPCQLAEQIAITRELKAHGQFFYHMGGITVDQWLQMEQAYKERAVPPYLKR